MASDMKKPNAITVIASEDVPKMLWPLPVGELFGVGRRIAKRLDRMNIRTIGDLAQAPEELLERTFGLNGRYLHLWANGIDDSPIDPHAMDDVKSMGHSTTLPEMLRLLRRQKRCCCRCQAGREEVRGEIIWGELLQ